MVAGVKLAISLWARGGSNLLIQSHGLGARVVQDATKEVAQTLGVFAAGRGRSNLDGSGDNAPAFALGQLKVLRGRYMVTYRLVNAVYVMVVTDPAANAFLCVQLLEAVTKILVAAARGVDVTPDKIARKYHEVYSLLDGLLDGGLAVLPPAFAHRSATADLLLTMPASATDAAHKLRKMLLAGKEGVAGLPKKAAGEGGQDPTPPPVPGTPATPEGRAFAPEEVDPLAKVSFDIPPDALPPPPSRAAVSRRAPPAPAPAAYVPPVAFQGAVKTQEEIEAEAAAAEAAAAAAAAAALKQAGLTAPEVAEEGGWAQFAEEEPAAPAPAPPPVQEPVVSEKDVRDSLQLLEVWRAEVAGGRLTKAGVEGSVRLRLAPYGLNRARFRLRPARSPLVNACMRAALLNAQFAEKQQSGAGEGFTAAIARAPVGCSYLKYRLPAVACAPPLQLALHIVPGAEAAGRSGAAPPQLLVVLRYVADPKAHGALLDAVVDLDLPPQIGGLVKVSPSGQWAKDRCQLRWELGRVLPAQEGLLRAVVSVKPGVALGAALAAAQQQAVAKVLFTGQRGRTLSGLGLEAGMEVETADYLPGGCQYFGEVTLRP